MKILVINSGSSSIKYQFYDTCNSLSLCKGIVERIGSRHSSIKHSCLDKRNYFKQKDISSHHKAIECIFNILICPKYGVINSYKDISAIGHRVVHGAEVFRRPTLIDAKVIRSVEGFSELAPLHNPPAVLGIKACMRLVKNIPQTAVFDTAYHHTIPDYAYVYGLPYDFYRKYKIRRYGFHGTSHKFVAYKASDMLKKSISRLNLITCHLGNGCSITAIKHGKSIDTSMGFTPLEGLLMGTRSGDIDPAAVLYAMEKKSMDLKEADNLLNKKSGILGLSGISNDMRDVLKRAGQGNIRAKLAVDIFIYRIKKYIGAYTAVMGALDGVILTGGIGENSIYIKRRIAAEMKGFLNKFKAKLLIIPTDEEWMIAQETAQVMKAAKHRR